MTADEHGIEFGTRLPNCGHIACPSCGDPLHETENVQLQCEACGHAWQSLGIDYRQSPGVYRLKRVHA